MGTVCYMFVVGVVSDMPTFMATYQQGVEPLITKFGGRYLVRGGPLQLLEGNFGGNGGMVLSVWPTRQHALDFWHSKEYAEVKKLRAGLGEFQVVLVDADEI